MHKSLAVLHQKLRQQSVATIRHTKEKIGKLWHILAIIYTIYYISRANILEYKEKGRKLRWTKTRQNSQNRGGGKFCIKIKFFKKTKKVVYISANCTYNVNIKKC